MLLTSSRIRPFPLFALLLSACGVPTESSSVPHEETVGSVESTLCSGLSVTSLTVAGASSYGGELGAAGNWEVSAFANGVSLEFYVDGQLQARGERPFPTGTWNHSSAGLGCGTHTLEVRAWPMVIDSSGNRTTCTAQGPRVVSRSFSQTCPSAAIQCQRTSSQQITCTGSSSGGTGPLTPLWQQENRPAHRPDCNLNMPWYEGAWSHVFYCERPRIASLDDAQVQVEFKVRDSTGMESTVRSSLFHCIESSIDLPYCE